VEFPYVLSFANVSNTKMMNRHKNDKISFFFNFIATRGRNFIFHTTKLEYHETPSYTEIGQCLLAKVMSTNIRQTDRHATDNNGIAVTNTQNSSL